MELIVTVCTLVGCAASIIFAVYRMIKGLRTEFREEFKAMRTQFREDLTSMRKESREDLGVLRSDVRVLQANQSTLAVKLGEVAERLARLETRAGIPEIFVEASASPSV